MPTGRPIGRHQWCERPHGGWGQRSALWMTVPSCGTPVSPESSPSRPQAVPDAVPTPALSRRCATCFALCVPGTRPRDPVTSTSVLNLQPTSEGVLPGQLLERAIRAGYIDAGRFNIPDANVQPASLDLRLGERALRIRCSFLPGTDSVERKLKDYILDEIDLRGDGAMLEARCPYLIELKERLDLPAGLRGKANPKSSTGRIDVFTRVITDNSDRFDEVAPGYHGPLYLEVVPLSFAVRVREDLTLNQLRLSIGRPVAQRRRGPADPSGGADPLQVGRAGARRRPRPFERALPGARSAGRRAGSGRAQHPGQRAAARPDVGRRGRPDAVLGPRLPGGRRPPRPVPEALLPLDVERGGEHPAQPGGRNDGLRPDERRAAHALRGVLRSRASGSIRPGASAVRAPRSRCAPHDVPFMVENGQAVCKLTFERMLEEPTSLYGSGIGSSYQQQEETLSRYFRRSPG